MDTMKQKEKNNNKYVNGHKRKRLLVRLGAIFVSFFVALILINAVILFIIQKNRRAEIFTTDVESMYAYFCDDINEEGDILIDLVDYFKAHGDELEVSPDYKETAWQTQDDFLNILNEEFPGGTYYQVSMLSDEGQKVWAKWQMEHYFCKFDDMKEDFNLSFVYFIYPEDEEKHEMCYMFDPTGYTKTTEDGEEVLDLGDVVYEDPEIHENMWKCWETGKPTGKLDYIDNEYGTVMAYCMPVYSYGKKVGLMVFEVNTDQFVGKMMTDVSNQLKLNMAIILVTLIVLLNHIYNKIVKRITVLESDIERYSIEKDPEIADSLIKRIRDYDEIGALGYGFAEMIEELKNYMDDLTRVTAEKERIGAELDVAARIQESMLPNIFPAFPQRHDLDLYAAMDPAKEVGGDFYDFFMLDDNRMAIVMADVSGKGVPASLFMVIAKTILKNNLTTGMKVDEALAHTNDQLGETNDEMLFVTVWAGVIDLTTRMMEYSDAGHETAFVLGKNGVTAIDVPNKMPPLGCMDGMVYDLYSMQLEKGDSVFLYTDGVPEATNSDNELFGMERLEEVLKTQVDASPKELLAIVRASVDEFVSDAEQFDDLTMLCLKLAE